MKSLTVQKNNKRKGNIIKDVRNLFILKKINIIQQLKMQEIFLDWKNRMRQLKAGNKRY